MHSRTQYIGWVNIRWMILFSILQAFGLQTVFGQASFYRGINLNGPAVVIDGRAWEGDGAQDFACSNERMENNQVALNPKVGVEAAKMIRTSQWGKRFSMEVRNVPDDEYQIFAYVWEDNRSTSFDLFVNQRRVLEKHQSGAAGSWKRLGPWKSKPTEGILRVEAQGGDANVSGLEIWRGEGVVPPPDLSGFNRTPTVDEMAFFENRIRPLLVEHCYECHSVDSKEVGGGLLLDSHRGIERGGDNGQAIEPLDLRSSLIFQAVQHAGNDLKMPPAGPLRRDQVEDLAKWIEMGAPDPRDTDTVALRKTKSSIDWEKARDFWSLRPVAEVELPIDPEDRWSLKGIDRFVWEGLKKEGLSPSPDADRSTWIRRVTYDLTGLPPSLEEIDAFLADTSERAFEKVVDRLLASKQYGERWGRHWLDVVRYSDTAGDNSDFPIPQMIKYRDWVLDAFQSDLPYDRFVLEQLAGDLLPYTSTEEQKKQVIATGYIAGARRFGSRVDDYPQHLTIEDTLDNLGKTFLATTLNCARCHDHKFDPVTTEDYYALYGIFHSTRYPWPGIELDQRQRDLVPLIEQDQAKKALDERESKIKEFSDRHKSLVSMVEKASEEQKKAIEVQVKEAKESLDSLQKAPLPFDQAYALQEGAKFEDVAVQIKGDPLKVGDVVPRRFLKVLHGEPLKNGAQGSGRLELARWIIDPKNPLTSRVMVNRIWLGHFGTGIVKTPNDFGRQGREPTHPELLDWLANQFQRQGWSIKAMHREVVLSRTYRQASSGNGRSLQVDPGNTLYGRFPRRRLDAESIRDTLLVLSGQLDESRGGPHPFPPQSEWKFTQHNPFKAIYESNHRSVYLMTQRIQRHPYLAIFDGADPASSTPQRLTSTTPIQALYFLNDSFVHSQASGFAKRLIQRTMSDEDRLDIAFRMTTGRPPSKEERLDAMQFLRTVSETESVESDRGLSAWEAMVRVLFRLNEFVYVD